VIEPQLEDFLARTGLSRDRPALRWVPLSGGVSSDIWRVDLADGSQLCVKRALPKLRVAAEWVVPVSRNAHEWAWIQFAAQVVPAAVPVPLAHDPQAGLFAMSWLDPSEHPVWKQQLLAGNVDSATAQQVGRVLGQIHSASAGREDLRIAFDTTETFNAIRLDPYLLHTAYRHPDVAPTLRALASRTAAHRGALVHGDVSPKNILVGPHGPVLLDAECAWYGDPAFDLAFCLNHLLLKAVPRPDCATQLATAFAALTESYFEAATFEPRDTLESRAADLLPALLLARVDGKSPVEYITQESQRERVRSAALPLIGASSKRLADIAARCLPCLAHQPAT
jgi:aminoglycoside phosphotransferase (APT) family kinase protein